MFSQKIFRNLRWPYVGVLLLVTLIIAQWSFNLSHLPGLHGDEAWSGLKAYKFSQKGISQIKGMNTYTGILQAILVQFLFKFFGIGVFQLRIGGVVLNAIGLCMISIYLNRKYGVISTLLFLFVLGGSTLYLISPRIAWEVNTFTLFLSSLALICFMRVLEEQNKANKFVVALFLLTNIVGSYDHIIFSSLPVAALLAVFAWSLYHRTSIYLPTLYLLIINMINIAITFFAMREYDQLLWSNAVWLILIIPAILLVELKVFVIFGKHSFPTFLKLKIPKIIIRLILIIGLIPFFYFHGLAFFDTIAGYKLFLLTYSYQISKALEYLLIGSAFCICLYSIAFVFRDLAKNRCTLFAFFIISYCGILCVYTTGTAYRYYLGLSLIQAAYIMFKLNQKRNLLVLLMIPIAITFILTNSIQLVILNTENRPVKAIKFKRGRSQIGSSEHYLPKEPLLDYLIKNRIKHIRCKTDNCYFLIRPLLFYKLYRPWEECPENKISVSYDYKNEGTGFKIKRRK